MNIEPRMVDIIHCDTIDIEISDQFIWINVDGLCKFRASLTRCRQFFLQDRRKLRPDTTDIEE